MPGIDRDGGGIDMFPDLTTAVVTQLGRAGENLETEWQARLGEIAGLDSRLGNGPLGVLIAEQYNPAVDEIVRGMADTRASVVESVDIGHRCVGIYLEADRQSARNFGR
jgi:hypothetical protein